MSQAIHLDTSLTFVTPKALTGAPGSIIGATTFGSKHEHCVLSDEPTAEFLRSVGMAELGFAKVLVGSKDHPESVEFFAIDVKRNKKLVDRLRKFLTVRWVELVAAFEKKRAEGDGDALSVELNEAAGAIESFIELRRFLNNGTDPEGLKKSKRTVLLFHHSSTNAPTE